MKTCKFCGLPVMSGNVVHTDCAEAAIEAAALADSERRELEAYKATGLTAKEVGCLRKAAQALKNDARISRAVELLMADSEGRLVIFTEVPECLQ